MATNKPLTSDRRSALPRTESAVQRVLCQHLPLDCDLQLSKWRDASLAQEVEMFRITFVDGPTGVSVRIEGRLVGCFAQEVTQVIVLRDLPAHFVVDLTDLMFVDSAGEEALSSLVRIGARFVAENSYSLHLCERLHLPIATGPPYSPNANSGPTATVLPMFTPAEG